MNAVDRDLDGGAGAIGGLNGEGIGGGCVVAEVEGFVEGVGPEPVVDVDGAKAACGGGVGLVEEGGLIGVVGILNGEESADAASVMVVEAGGLIAGDV